MDLDVIVEIDPRAPPSANSQSSAGKATRASRSIVSNCSLAQAEVAHGTIVHALHDEGDRRVAFGEREERQMAQSPQNVGLGESDAGLDLGLVRGFPGRAGRTPTE